MLFKNSIRALLGLLLALPAGAFALGLGEIHLFSPADAPLNAQVEIIDAVPGNLNTLQARIASPETYARYGLDYPSYLAGVQAAAVRTADGKAVIQLKSSEPVHQATLLVELNWAEGRLARVYRVLGQ
jgi:pilus assembly protein FimV